MRNNLSIGALISNPNFGNNVLIKQSLDMLAQCVVLSYKVGPRGASIKISRPHPIIPDASLTQYVDVKPDSSNAAITTFLQKLRDNAYTIGGDLQSDDLKEDLIPIRTQYIHNSMDYGTDPELVSVSPVRNGQAFVRFTSVRDNRRYNHSATWTLFDAQADLNRSIIVPRTLYTNYREFLQLVAEAAEIDINRLNLKADPMAPGEFIHVYINANDLIYTGSFKVALPPEGDAVRIIDNSTGEEILPEEPDVLAASVAITGGNFNLTVGEAQQLDVTVLPADTTDKTVTYVSSNPTKVSVNSAGLVQSIAVGSAIITVTTTNNKTATVTVTAPEPQAGEPTA